MAAKPEDPQSHMHYVPDELAAYRKYAPTRMAECWGCGNWYPEQYCCPACGNDPTEMDDA